MSVGGSRQERGPHSAEHHDRLTRLRFVLRTRFHEETYPAMLEMSMDATS